MILFIVVIIYFKAARCFCLCLKKCDNCSEKCLHYNLAMYKRFFTAHKYFTWSFYLGEKGEMSCLSLAQLMVGGGTLWTSHGKMASSPAITDILIGATEPPLPDLGRTGHACNSIQNVCDNFIWGKKKP